MKLDARLAMLLKVAPSERGAELAALSEQEQRALKHHWEVWARPEQLPPMGDWRVWLVMAGRGFGKTRAGAEWVRRVAFRDPDARIALVGASLGEVRAVMVEGESGVMSVGPVAGRPRFEPSLRRLTWANGAQAMIYGAGEPELLRGPQHSHAWCDEIAKWDHAGGRAEAAWTNLLLGMRLGEAPRVVATTTPRAVALLKRVIDEDGVVVTRGGSADNAVHLPLRFLDDMRRALGGTSLVRQELEGELILDTPGALWTRAMLEGCRESGPVPAMARVVVGVDPPASDGGDACGIVVVGLGEDGVARVLADASVARPSPERWARAVAEAACAWSADRVVAEANQGGAMVESVLRAAEVGLPVRLVHARVGKVARAEPVAALYEAGRVRHAGVFGALEDELCGFVVGEAYAGPGRSPDRADACVWALTELLLGRAGAVPRVHRLF